ncbi:hypothetical protein [Methylophaga nitratireducenticrescens]|nr:hypothetical protein [Methylophaga nitratireducenticrescens]ASF49114.1 hypothetical protein Q7A_03525 [Methylophaga nitratireducenticrescens]
MSRNASYYSPQQPRNFYPLSPHNYAALGSVEHGIACNNGYDERYTPIDNRSAKQSDAFQPTPMMLVLSVPLLQVIYVEKQHIIISALSGDKKIIPEVKEKNRLVDNIF